MLKALVGSGGGLSKYCVELEAVCDFDGMVDTVAMGSIPARNTEYL